MPYDHDCDEYLYDEKGNNCFDTYEEALRLVEDAIITIQEHNQGDLPMKTVSIGFMRDDGDLALVATLNNLDEHMSDENFNVLVDGVKNYIGLMTKRNDVLVLEREDAPDYITID
jgi:hypothetical protein